MAMGVERGPLKERQIHFCAQEDGTDLPSYERRTGSDPLDLSREQGSCAAFGGGVTLPSSTHCPAPESSFHRLPFSALARSQETQATVQSFLNATVHPPDKTALWRNVGARGHLERSNLCVPAASVAALLAKWIQSDKNSSP